MFGMNRPTVSYYIFTSVYFQIKIKLKYDYDSHI